MCSEMERCEEIVAERFKASTKKINQNLVDAIVSVHRMQNISGRTACEQHQTAVFDRGETLGQGQLQ